MQISWSLVVGSSRSWFRPRLRDKRNEYRRTLYAILLLRKNDLDPGASGRLYYNCGITKRKAKVKTVNSHVYSS